MVEEQKTVVDGDGDGRVTLAVVRNDLKHLTQLVEQMREESRGRAAGCTARITELERWQVRTDERWESHKGEHWRQNTALGVASTVESIVAAVVGVFVSRDGSTW